MRTVVAKLNKEYKIDTSGVNNGRTDGTSFWTDGKIVTVSNWATPLSIEEQESELRWYLSYLKFDIQYS